jgi:FtsZ-binding cell division protein ZapB
MDEDLKLIEHLRQNSGVSALGRLMGHAATTITRLRAEIEALKSDVSDLVRAGSDEATENERLVRERDEALSHHFEALKVYSATTTRAETAEAQRDAALKALKPFADAHAALKRSGYLVAPNGTALMYDPQDPKFLGPFVEDLARAHRVFEGGPR